MMLVRLVHQRVVSCRYSKLQSRMIIAVVGVYNFLSYICGHLSRAKASRLVADVRWLHCSDGTKQSHVLLGVQVHSIDYLAQVLSTTRDMSSAVGRIKR
jgi:hypothetical protein